MQARLHVFATSRNVVTYAQADHQVQGPKRRRSTLQRQRTPPHQPDRGTSSTAAASLATAAAAPTLADTGAALQRHALQVLSRYRALVVDASYRPIDVVNWQRAICMDLLEKADVLEYYDATISSTREEYYLPAVMKARWYNGKKPIRVALSRRNILLRDKLCCVYCGKSGKNGAVPLTLDHVTPQSKGGGNTWENLVTACAQCNTKKGDKTLKQLKWKLKKEPQEPSAWELDLVLASVGAGDLKSVPEEWAGYLFYEKSSSITSMPQPEANSGSRGGGGSGNELKNRN